jgi:hypothetical protein
MLYGLQVSVAVTGTAVPLASTRTMATWVNIQAGPDNSTTPAAGMTVGPASVSGPEGANPCVILPAGAAMFLPQVGSPGPYDLSTIYINGTAGDEAEVLYFKR